MSRKHREAEVTIHQQMLAIRARDQEISRLRRDLMLVSSKQTDRSRAYSRVRPSVLRRCSVWLTDALPG